jgi:signal peptidase
MRIVSRLAGMAVCLAAVAIAATLLVPAALGFQRYVVVSGSMTGTYDQGSLIFDKPVPVRSLKVGDVITYRPPRHAQPVTHRIVWRGVDRNGRTAFRTKGDANQTPDHWRFTPNTTELPRVEFGLPKVGYVYSALNIPAVRLLGIIVPALGLALLVLVGWWREAGEQARVGEVA